VTAPSGPGRDGRPVRSTRSGSASRGTQEPDRCTQKTRPEARVQPRGVPRDAGAHLGPALTVAACPAGAVITASRTWWSSCGFWCAGRADHPAMGAPNVVSGSAAGPWWPGRGDRHGREVQWMAGAAMDPRPLVTTARAPTRTATQHRVPRNTRGGHAALLAERRPAHEQDRVPRNAGSVPTGPRAVIAARVARGGRPAGRRQDHVPARGDHPDREDRTRSRLTPPPAPASRASARSSSRRGHCRRGRRPRR